MMASIDSTLARTNDDQMAHLHACAALSTPHSNEVMEAVSCRTDFFADERAKVAKVTMAKVAEKMNKPCVWVRRLTPSVPTLEETRHWGFIGFREATTEWRNEVWETFLKWFDQYVTCNSLNWLNGGPAIDPTKKLVLRDGFVIGNDHERLCKYVYYLSFTLNLSAKTPPNLSIDTSIRRSFKSRHLD